MNKFIDCIKTRRSVRYYKNKKIDRSVVKDIVEAGLQAPSAKNSQPWYLIVLHGDKKNQIANMMMEKSCGINNVPINITDPKKAKDIFDSTIESAQIIKQASHLILMFNRAPYSVSEDILIKNMDKANLFSYSGEIVGIGACMQNMLLAARAYGLGSVPMSDLYVIKDEMKEFLDCKFDFVVAVALGFADFEFTIRKINNKDNYYKFEK